MHFTPDMLPVKGRRFERSQQAILFSKNVSRWCAVALALICVQLDISRFYLLCKVWLHMQAEPPREKVIITGSTEEMPFRPFQALWSNHRLKKSKWSWEWHTFFIFFLCSCCCWRTAIRYLTVCETLWSQNALFMYMARIIVPYQPGLVVATHRD